MTPPEIYAWRPQADSKPNDSSWQVRVIPNRIPVLRVEGLLDPRPEGMYDKMNGIGANEVMILSPGHDQDWDDLPAAHAEQVLHAVRERFLDLRKDQRIQYVQAFQNRGPLAGAAVDHPHLQLIGLPLVPKNLREKLEGVARHWNARGRCIYCDILRETGNPPNRLVLENDHYAALTPYASRVPFETWIIPKQHQADFSASDPASLKFLAQILQTLLHRLRIALRDPAYHLIWNTQPLQNTTRQEFHWHLEVLPRLAPVNGFELGTGCSINQTAPEEAAACLRELPG